MLIRNTLPKFANLLTVLVLVVKYTEGFPSEYVSQLSVNEKIVHIIQNNRDLSVDPCTNFFKHACGSWSKYQNIRRYSEIIGLMDHKLNRKISKFLDAYQSAGNPENIYDKAHTYYKACRFEKTKDWNRYLKLIQPAKHIDWALFHMINGTHWPSGDFNWMLTLGKLRLHGVNNILIKHSVIELLNDPTKAYLDFGMPENAGELPERDTIMSALSFLDAEPELAENITNNVVALERELKKLISMQSEDEQIYDFELYELEKALPELPWQQYLKIFLGDDVEDTLKIQISNADYFESLSKLMQVNPVTVSHYMMLHLLFYLVDDITTSFDNIDCLVDLRTKMELAVNYIYKENYYDGQADEYQSEVERIVELLQRELSNKLSENNLGLAAAEIEALKLKIRSIKLNIGNLPKNIDKNFITQYYADARVEPKQYYRNHLRLLEHRTRQEHARILYGVPTDDDFFAIGDSNTGRFSTPIFYMRHNTIIVPYGILQPPFFHKNMHDVFKLSLLGFIMAHEIIHGFDVSGILFNGQGVYDETLAKGLTANQLYNNSLECLQESPTESIDERIADVVGIRLAYDVIFGSNSTLGQEQPKFTVIPLKRLFFLNAAHFFCNSMTFGIFGHDTDDVRLRDVLINFEPFAEHFQCDFGDNMNPEKKCRMW